MQGFLIGRVIFVDGFPDCAVCSKTTYSIILLIMLLGFAPLTVNAQEQEESRWFWRAGITASISTYMQARDGGEGPTFDVSLSERYGKYHGNVYSIPPLSFDVNYRLFKFLDLSAGLSWVPMWGKVYNSFDAVEGNTVFANNFILIPSFKLNYINRYGLSIYSSAGFGLGIHFNRSDSRLIGTDHWGYHNDYMLEKGKNSITKQLEVVILGVRGKFIFWEFGVGSKFWGYGSRLGVQFDF